VNWLCTLGFHKFVWPDHDRPFAIWTYFIWCDRGCGNFIIRLCNKYEHGVTHKVGGRA
jgi:hypothetical protein